MYQVAVPRCIFSALILCENCAELSSLARWFECSVVGEQKILNPIDRVDVNYFRRTSMD